VIKLSTDAERLLGSGRIPQSLEELEGERRHVAPKEADVSQRRDDVWEQRWSAGGGFGDPLERDPERVLRDVLLGCVSAEVAFDSYGVSIEDAAIDSAATAATRSRRLRRRSNEGGGALTVASAPSLALGPTLALHGSGGSERVACRGCRTSLGPLSGWKRRAVRDERPADLVNPAIEPARSHVDQEVLVRQFCCPGCGRALDAEVALWGEVPADDIWLGASDTDASVMYRIGRDPAPDGGEDAGDRDNRRTEGQR
jgi:N-methylhydantoinase B